MCLKKISKVFLECFNEVLFYDFVVAWISSQLPEQKEGFFQAIEIVHLCMILLLVECDD